jgi:pimeloyl-ACP methyl ester carboxylesterase
VHGLAGTRQHGYRFLPDLHRAGFPTMLISYRNDPGTAADPSPMHAYGLTEWHDLDAAVRYALDHGAGNVLLAGESMGAAIIGQFLRHSARAGRVSALVLDSPAVDMPLTIRAQAVARHVPFSGWIAGIGIWLADRRFPVQLSQARSLTTMQGFPGPMFVAQGDRDPLVPVGLADSLASGRAAPTTYLRTRGAGHGESYYADPDRYRRALAAFLTALPR